MTDVWMRMCVWWWCNVMVRKQQLQQNIQKPNQGWRQCGGDTKWRQSELSAQPSHEWEKNESQISYRVLDPGALSYCNQPLTFKGERNEPQPHMNTQGNHNTHNWCFWSFRQHLSQILKPLFYKPVCNTRCSSVFCLFNLKNKSVILSPQGQGCTCMT